MGEPKQGRRQPPRWWRLAVGWAIPALTAAACLVLLWSFVPPSGSFPVFVLGAWALLVLAGFWAISVVIGLIRYGSNRLAAIAPVIVISTAVLVVFSVPSRFGWWLSKDDLRQAAIECVDPAGSEWIGMYRVLSAHRVGDHGCRFTLEGGLINIVGVAYLPGEQPYLGEPRRDGDIGYRHIDGDWYSFVQVF